MEESGTDLVEVIEDLREVGVQEEQGQKGTVDGFDDKVLTDKMVLLMQKISEYGYLTIEEAQLGFNPAVGGSS